jgi:hypothetical protein
LTERVHFASSCDQPKEVFGLLRSLLVHSVRALRAGTWCIFR